MLTDGVIGASCVVGGDETWTAGVDAVAPPVAKSSPTTNVTDSRSRSSSLADESSRSRRYLLTSVR